MADSMWEWYGDDAASVGSKDLFAMMRDMIKGNQGDPAEVVTRIVELVEATSTDENNFVPADLKQQLGLA
jgi:hypothetical protein